MRARVNNPLKLIECFMCEKLTHWYPNRLPEVGFNWVANSKGEDVVLCDECIHKVVRYFAKNAEL